MIRFFLFYVMLFTFSCGKKQASQYSIVLEQDSILYPYAPVYTSDFHRGKKSNSKIVLEIWKEFETGDVRHLSANFSDTLTLVFPDIILYGRKDSLLSIFQKRRTNFEDVQCYVDSWLPVDVPDKNEELVFVWGRQDGTTSNGKRSYRILHEIWRFTKSGRIKRMEQYITHSF